MQVIPENQEDIVAIITAEFRTFGGGRVSTTNPIAAALQNHPPSFAAGVDVADVVARVIELQAMVAKQNEVVRLNP